MAKWECPDCHTLNANPSQSCEICGTPKITARALGPSRVCWFDGGHRRADGFCEVGQGYPVGTVCPFVCPICRHRLQWDGGCQSCYGTSTGQREDWTMPGDRYELTDDLGHRLGDGQHWVRIAAGPRACLSLAEVKMLMAELKRIVAPLTGTVRAPEPSRAEPAARVCATCGVVIEGPDLYGATCTPCWFSARAVR